MLCNILSFSFDCCRFPLNVFFWCFMILSLLSWN
jgi:hypothetical protein